MAKRALPKTKATRTPPRPKPKVMQAALLMWSHRIYHAADAVVTTQGGYSSHKQNPEHFKIYVQVFKLLRELSEKLDAMAGKEVVKAQYFRGGCEDDQDCPDDQICVHGSCEPLFPQS